MWIGSNDSLFFLDLKLTKVSKIYRTVKYDPVPQRSVMIVVLAPLNLQGTEIWCGQSRPWVGPRKIWSRVGLMRSADTSWLVEPRLSIPELCWGGGVLSLLISCSQFMLHLSQQIQLPRFCNQGSPSRGKMFGRFVTTANGAEVLSACGFFDAQSDSSDILKAKITSLCSLVSLRLQPCLLSLLELAWCLLSAPFRQSLECSSLLAGSLRSGVTLTDLKEMSLFPDGPFFP